MFKSLYFIYVAVFLFIDPLSSFAQKEISTDDGFDQHIFSYDEIYSLEDAEGKLTLETVRALDKASKFRPNEIYNPKNTRLDYTYWYKIKVRHTPNDDKNWILEFYDQTIDEITLFAPDVSGGYTASQMGDNYAFNVRAYKHKNFSVKLNDNLAGINTYYIRMQSHEPANMIVVLKTATWYMDYALDEYFFFGLFYGMVVVFALYNLMMFFAMRQIQHLYYVLYNISIGLYEMCADGIAYQYLWPNSPAWNQFAFALPLCTASIFALLFTQSLLHLRTKNRRLYKLLNVIIALRITFFLICLLFNNSWFNFKFIEIIPLGLAFFAGIRVYMKGYRPARFFVIGYSFLLLGFLIKTLITLDVPWIPFGPVTHYSLSFCFLMEMLFVSFAIGDKVRLLKKKKDKAQKHIIDQLRYNEELKDKLNSKLERQVQERTKEVIEQSAIISRQNQDLVMINSVLKEQADEISRMNLLLQTDNRQLQTNIEKVTRARVMSEEVNYEEFSKIYPNAHSCYEYLEDLKWAAGYNCRKCANDQYINGHMAYSRRCTKCDYEESVIANTVFQNTHLPIDRAFYMLFLIYSSKGKISSHKLSEILKIRQSTCWSYSSRIKKLMEDNKKLLRNAGEKGWSLLIMEKIHKVPSHSN